MVTPTLDLMSIIFDQILKISPVLQSQYPLVQDKLIYLLLIPHAILLLFLYSFAMWIVQSGHRGFNILFMLIGYVFIIYAGFYGTILIPLFVNYFVITVGISIFFFIMSRILPMNYLPGLIKLGSETGKAVGKATVGKGKEEKALKSQIQVLGDFIRKNEGSDSDRVKQLVAEAELEKRKMEEKLKHL